MGRFTRFDVLQNESASASRVLSGRAAPLSRTGFPLDVTREERDSLYMLQGRRGVPFRCYRGGRAHAGGHIDRTTHDNNSSSSSMQHLGNNSNSIHTRASAPLRFHGTKQSSSASSRRPTTHTRGNATLLYDSPPTRFPLAVTRKERDSRLDV